ncbi:MAG: hypothetical protein J6Z35_08545 [Lachnospiraceae bacterium]|nr:hypothetical protein [Lachnospiraceae bacterium]
MSKGDRRADFMKAFSEKEQITGFAAIDTLGKAHMMVDRGMLEPLYLHGLRFGGTESPENRVYVPIGIARLKDQKDDEIEKLMKEGKIKDYKCTPKYKNMSRVPYEIEISACSAENDQEIVYSQTISIW